MLLYLIYISLFLLGADSKDNCDKLKDFANNHLVEKDPTQYLDGSYVNYWIYPRKTDHPLCSYTEYSKNKDVIKAKTTFTDTKGKTLFSPTEDFLKKSKHLGFYEITSSRKDKSGKASEFHGHSAVFYADENVVGHQYCVAAKDGKSGKSFEFIITVRKDKMDKFLHPEDATKPNEVHKSLQEANKRFTEIVILVTEDLDPESKNTAPLERKVENMPSGCPI